MKAPDTPDIRFENAGTVTFVQPLTGRAWHWVRSKLAVESWQWLGGGIAVEPRCAPEIAESARAAGLVVA